MDYNKTLESIIKIIKEVGHYQVDKFKSRSFTLETKSTDIDVVTEVDKKSEFMLMQAFEKLHPDFGFLAEETGQVSKQSDYSWVIDPLDGTTNFSVGVPVFAISVALRKHQESQIGVVYIPLTGDLYTAIKGQGAYKNGQAIKVNNNQSLRQAVLATGFPYDRAENPINNVQEFSILAPKVKGVRRLGVAAYDLCLVAEGVFGGYWEFGIKDWDFAAGLLIAQEAGALYHNLGRRDHSMIVSNPYIFNELKSLLTE